MSYAGRKHCLHSWFCIVSIGGQNGDKENRKGERGKKTTTHEQESKTITMVKNYLDQMSPLRLSTSYPHVGQVNGKSLTQFQ